MDQIRCDAADVADATAPVTDGVGSNRYLSVTPTCLPGSGPGVDSRHSAELAVVSGYHRRMPQPSSSTTTVRLGRDDRDAAVAALTVAFAGDPVIRWVLSAPDAYLRVWGPFIDAFAGDAFERGTAFGIDACSAVALWLPPGAESDGEAMQELMSDGSDESIGDDLEGVFEQMEAFHPSFEHWYLPLIGVDPLAQGRGLGSALMRHVLAEVDAAGLPSYLEATSARNRALYERHGYEPIGLIQHGGSPPMWPMVRHPG